MTIELTYNQLKAPKQTRLSAIVEAMADAYYSKPAVQFGVDLTFFIVGCAIVAALAVAAA